MDSQFKEHLAAELDGIKAAGLYKSEREITTAQGARVGVKGSSEVLNLCANNYLGLSQHSAVRAANPMLCNSKNDWTGLQTLLFCVPGRTVLCIVTQCRLS